MFGLWVSWFLPMPPGGTRVMSKHKTDTDLKSICVAKWHKYSYKIYREKERECHHIVKIIKPFMPVPVKKMTSLAISFLAKLSNSSLIKWHLENTWRRIIHLNSNYNSCSNIMQIRSSFQNYFQKYYRSSRFSGINGLNPWTHGPSNQDVEVHQWETSKDYKLRPVWKCCST